MGGSPVPNPFGGRRKPAPAPAPTPKSEEQPKVQAQMDAPKDENVQAQQSLDRKRKARRSTILTSSVGANEDVMLGYKTLLG